MIEQFKNQLKLKIIFFLLFLIVLCCSIFYLTRPLASVGDYKITKKDADYRDQIIFLNSPEEKRSMGLYQLIKSAINLQILKNNNIHIQESQIKAESQRIDINTKNPKQLKKIKDLFKDDVVGYEKNFVLPTLVDRMIYYDFFLKDENIHKISLQKAKDLILVAKKSNESFFVVAEQKGYVVKKLTVSLKNGLKWSSYNNSNRNQIISNHLNKISKNINNDKFINKNQNNNNPQSLQGDPVYDQVVKHLKLNDFNKNIEDAKKWYELVIASLGKNEIASSPINQDEKWLVVKYLGMDSAGDHQLEVVFVDKLSYSDWYEIEKNKIEINIYDKTRLVP